MSHGETHPSGFGMCLSFYYGSAVLSHPTPSWTHFRTDLVSSPRVLTHPAPGFSCQDHRRDYGGPPRPFGHNCAPPPIDIYFHTKTCFLFLQRREHRHAQCVPKPHNLESLPLGSGTLHYPRGERGLSCGEPYFRKALQPPPRSL